jgi:hypothetical protein
MADPAAREFDLADILSITTGRLLSRRHIDGVYDILNHLTGDNLMTHQLPRAAETCRPALLAQHPQLDGVQPPEDMAVPELWKWLAGAETAYGARLPVTPIADWEHRNPIEELAQMIGPDRVVVLTDVEAQARPRDTGRD